MCNRVPLKLNKCLFLSFVKALSDIFIVNK